MNLKFTKPIEIKSIDEKGSFTGYAATFGNIDLGDLKITADTPLNSVASFTALIEAFRSSGS